MKFAVLFLTLITFVLIGCGHREDKELMLKAEFNRDGEYSAIVRQYSDGTIVNEWHVIKGIAKGKDGAYTFYNGDTLVEVTGTVVILYPPR